MQGSTDQPGKKRGDAGAAIAELLAWQSSSTDKTDRLEEMLAEAITALEQADVSAELRNRALDALERFREACEAFNHAADSGRFNPLRAELQGHPSYLNQFSRREHAKSRLRSMLPAFSGPHQKTDQPKPAPSEAVVLTDAEQEVWDALEDQFKTAKEIAKKLDLAPSDADLIRKRINRMRGRGFEIQNLRPHGYWRPDAPPPGHRPQPDTSESG